MLDNLRDQASFQEEEEEPLDPNAPKPPKPRRSFDQITGMTARQRFAMAVMLSIMVCLLGTMLLLIYGKMVPSFMF
ncbi:MAG: hypothetical protein Q8N46_06990 [Anaerolineales bacterium]|nr:hypothetical protein [Anaerolineales bacterium]